jgi:hypothetical protein
MLWRHAESLRTPYFCKKSGLPTSQTISSNLFRSVANCSLVCSMQERRLFFSCRQPSWSMRYFRSNSRYLAFRKANWRARVSSWRKNQDFAFLCFGTSANLTAVRNRSPSNPLPYSQSPCITEGSKITSHDVRGLPDAHRTRSLRVTFAWHVRDSSRMRVISANPTQMLRTCRTRSAQQGMFLLDPSLSTWWIDCLGWGQKLNPTMCNKNVQGLGWYFMSPRYDFPRWS